MTHGQAMHNAGLFSTEDLGFAAFLQASGTLKFLRCEVSNRERIAFVFHDRQHEGEQVRLAYETGAQCSATGFYASLKGFRRLMTEVLNQNRRASKDDYQPGRL